MAPYRGVWRTAALVLGITVLCTAWAEAAAPPVRLDENGAQVLREEPYRAEPMAAPTSLGEQVVQNGVRYALNGDSASVVGYTVEIPKICTIPAEITVDEVRYTVTSIADSGLYNCAQIQSIQLPETLQSIGMSAFAGCTSLQKLTIPASVTEIGVASGGAMGNGVFVDCSSLTAIYVEEGSDYYSSRDGVLFDQSGQVLYCYPMGKTERQYTVPEGTQIISAYGFYRAERLTDIVLADTVTRIGEEAFAYCSNLEHIDLGDALETVGASAFDWCNALQALSFPATLRTVQGHHYNSIDNLTAFEVADGCQRYYSRDGVLFERLTEGGVRLWGYPAKGSNTEYTVPDEVTELGNNSFDHADNLREIRFTPDSQLQTIQFGAFSSCSGLTRITLPDTVTELGGCAFQNCWGLQEIQLGEGITSLADGLFSGCEALIEVTIPRNVTTINATAFRGCTSMERFSVAEGNTTFYAADGVLYSLGSEQRLVAYPAARNESTLTIPAGVTEISEGCFSANEALCEFRVEEGSTAFYAVDGVLFRRGAEGDTLHSYPTGKSGTQYRVPDGVTAIAEMAFYENTNLLDVDINQVKSIGSDAFARGYLEAINLGNVEELGDFCLISTYLKTVVFPESLKKIGGQVLDFCNDLEYIEFHGATPPEGRNDLCYESTALRYVYVPEGCQNAYKSFFTSGIYPGAMIVEGTYQAAETVEELIDGLTDSSDAASVHEAATAVVRLTSEDAEKLSDADLLKVENLFQKANPALRVTTDDNVEATTVNVEGAALASGLVEQGAAGAVTGTVAVSVREGALTEPGQLLNLAFELSVNGEEKQLQSPVIVTVALTQSMAQAAERGELQLIHRGDWDEEPVEYTIQDGNVTFRAASFSHYIFRQDSQVPEGVQRVYYTTAEAATVYLAGYDGTGRMLSLQGAEVTSGSGTLDFQQQEGMTFRVFLLDSEQKPVGTVSLAE